MATKNDVLKLGIDTIKGVQNGNFSNAEMAAGFREGLLELNGGSDKLSMKNFHRGTELFALVEEILPYIAEEGLKGDEFFMNLVDYRNVAEGDMNEFVAQNKDLFLVGKVGHGTQAARRQRLMDGQKITVPTTVHMIKVYEELRRLLAGRVNFNDLIARVAASYTADMRNEIYTAFSGITAATAGLNSTYVVSGSYDEDALLTLVEHVEAATGSAATIYGTKKALRKITTANVADDAKNDMYALGYYGRFNGTPMVAVKQAHQAGTDNFVLNDSKIYVLAGSDKPIKFVNEGQDLLIEHSPIENSDLTQEYAMASVYGAGIICNEKMGLYTITG